MPAAGVPIAASLLAPTLAETAGTALAGTALGTLAESAPWLLPAISGAGLGGIGSLITGQNPLTGALLGGVGGGIGSALGGTDALGSLFGGSGINPSVAETSGALASSAPQGLANDFAQGVGFQNTLSAPGIGNLYNAPTEALASGASSATGTAAAASPSFFSKMAGPAALGLGSLALDRFTAPGQVGPPLKDQQQARAVRPLDRTQQSVDPASYSTSVGNRNFYAPYSMQPQYYADGGDVNPKISFASPPRLADKNAPPVTSSKIQPAPVIPTKHNYMPLKRTYAPIDPSTYFHSDTVQNRMQFRAKGGHMRYFDDGGSASTGHSTLPVGLGMVKGRGDGMDDKIPAMLSDGEFVFSAPAVSAIGNGSNDAGAKKLAKMQKGIITKHYKGGKPRKAVGLGSFN